jgi:hypothetical protein
MHITAAYEMLQHRIHRVLLHHLLHSLARVHAAMQHTARTLWIKHITQDQHVHKLPAVSQSHCSRVLRWQ